MADTDSTAEAVNSKTEAEPEDGDSNAEAEPPCKRARSDDDDEDDADSNDQNGKCKPVPKPVTPGLTLEGTNLVFKTDTLNEHLICSLCMGYFRDAMGITECLHTFCRVCILQWVRTSKICPVCEADLGPAPNEKLRPDRVLQTIVDKVFPHFMKEDLLLEHAFWKDLGMEPPYELLPLPKEGEEEEDKKPSATYITPAMRKKAAQESARLKQAQQLKTEATLEKAVPDSSPAPPRARPQIGNDHKTKQQKQEMEEGVLDFKVTQELATRTSDNLLPHLVKPFLRTSTKLTISQLRRYLHLKLACPMDKVTISCGGRELHSELSLHEVNKTYWKKQEPMHIVYQVSGAA